MENEKQQGGNQQSASNSSDAESKQTKTTGSGSFISDEDIEPVLNEEDKKENQLKKKT